MAMVTKNHLYLNLSKGSLIQRLLASLRQLNRVRLLKHLWRQLRLQTRSRTLVLLGLDSLKRLLTRLPRMRHVCRHL